AFKFTHEGGVKLEVLKSEQDEVIIRVTDTGVGIARGKDHLLFERFSQIDAGFDKRVEGTGLGLAIVKNLASIMGGSVSFESVEGEGATFSVTLPLLRSSPPEAILIED